MLSFTRATGNISAEFKISLTCHTGLVNPNRRTDVGDAVEGERMG